MVLRALDQSRSWCNSDCSFVGGQANLLGNRIQLQAKKGEYGAGVL